MQLGLKLYYYFLMFGVIHGPSLAIQSHMPPSEWTVSSRMLICKFSVIQIHKGPNKSVYVYVCEGYGLFHIYHNRSVLQELPFQLSLIQDHHHHHPATTTQLHKRLFKTQFRFLRFKKPLSHIQLLSPQEDLYCPDASWFTHLSFITAWAYAIYIPVSGETTHT